MKLERKVRLCSAAAAVLIAAIALTGCGGSKSAASSAAASSVAASTAATNNSCGEGVTWALADGTLTISGTGRMTNFTKDVPAPWADQADQITTVEVEGTVTSVGATAFKDCTALTTVNIADGVEYIEAGAFNGCTALTEIALPSGVTEIQRNAFYGCKTLKRISIPAAVTAIGDDAFYNTALSDVYYGGTEEQWSAITIGSSNQRLTNAARHYNSPSF